MTKWIAPEVDSIRTPRTGDERTLLRSWLDQHRRTLLRKCAGLDGDALVLRSAAPSTLSLLGLVRHLTEDERGWFRIAAAGQPLDYLYCSEGNVDGDIDDADPAAAEANFATYRSEVELADAAVADLSLEHVFQWHDTDFSVRWVYQHMIEEYARHNGHADILRERIDGATGI
ncbi:DinB family protein [Nocardia callitridis]|uniref:DinB family protein n=1 Tax=Nocardia callitridis TaxID=648753 RepID=A0ABP9KMT2_9NOCA